MVVFIRGIFNYLKKNLLVFYFLRFIEGIRLPGWVDFAKLERCGVIGARKSIMLFYTITRCIGRFWRVLLLFALISSLVILAFIMRMENCYSVERMGWKKYI